MHILQMHNFNRLIGRQSVQCPCIVNYAITLGTQIDSLSLGGPPKGSHPISQPVYGILIIKCIIYFAKLFNIYPQIMLGFLSIWAEAIFIMKIEHNFWMYFCVFFFYCCRPSLKHSSRRGSKAAVADFTPEELFAGQFVVFTVYALLELPPTVGRSIIGLSEA